jgi:hypothetical protein
MYYPETKTNPFTTSTKPIMNKPTTPEVTLSDKLAKIIAFSEDGQVLVTKDHELPFSCVRTTPNLQAQILFYTMVYQSSENGKLVFYKTQGNVAYYLYTDVVLKVNAGLVGSTFKDFYRLISYSTDGETCLIQQAYKHFLSLQPKQKEPLKLSTSNLQSLITLVSSSITDKETNIKEAKDLTGAIPKDYLEDKNELFKYIQSEQQKIKKLVQIQTTMKRMKAQG